MRCPYCGNDSDRVVDSRSKNEGRVIRRRRLCNICERRFITVEEIEQKKIWVIKSDNRREVFDRSKLMRGIEIACIKRPVSTEQIESIVDNIVSEIEANFVREIESRQLGEMVSRALRSIDEVAYVRFASVYRKFEDKSEFIKELSQLDESDKEAL